VYSAGEAFPEYIWAEILIRFTNRSIISNECCISHDSASKSVLYTEIGMLPPSFNQGNGRVDVGSMCGFTMEHRLYIYHLYRRNPSRQLLGYYDVKKMKTKFGITISERLISRWLKTIGPFKGTLRLTSRFSPTNELVHQQHLFFTSAVDHHLLVLADQKPFKEKDLYDRVRGDPLTGIVPYGL
jgi:hypothetical protein